MPSVFISPNTNFAFKKIFGSTESKDILISFLDAILYDSSGSILDVEIVNPYQPPQVDTFKASYLDIKASIRNQDGSTKSVLIKMQVMKKLGFEKRILYNAAKAFSIQLDKGDGYFKLNPVIALTITDFTLFPTTPNVISRYVFTDRETSSEYPEAMELAFIELPKFHKPLEALDTLTDKWIYFLKSASDLETIPTKLQQDPALEHAFSIAQESRLNRQELELLEAEYTILRDQQGIILQAQQDGMEAGREAGERDSAIAIAKRLLPTLDDGAIAAATGLPLVTIQTLRTEVAS